MLILVGNLAIFTLFSMQQNGNMSLSCTSSVSSFGIELYICTVPNNDLYKTAQWHSLWKKLCTVVNHRVCHLADESSRLCNNRTSQKEASLNDCLGIPTISITPIKILIIPAKTICAFVEIFSVKVFAYLSGEFKPES